MKNELKISTLSIVCALCAATVMPAFGATAVRSLGGAGTYSSASSAASAKSASNGDSAISAARGGSMRVGTSTGASRSTSTRAATTPRLSIGKYLAGSSAVSGGANLGGSSSGGSGSDVSGNLQKRIVVLEEFMGFSTTGDNIPEQLDALDSRIDELSDKIDGLQGGGADNEAVSQLQQDTAALKSQVESFAAQLDNVATKDEVEGFITSAEVENVIKDMATKSDIQDLVSSGELQTEIAKLATKDEIADFVTSDDVTNAIAGLATADDVAKAIKDATSTLATKQELADAKSELQSAIDRINAGQVELTNYYTKTQTDAMLADYAKQSALAIIEAAIAANKTLIDENAADITSLEVSVADAASEAADAKLDAADALSAATSAQSTANAAKTAADSAQNLANLNASELAGLADVAKSGSYNDLLDQPTLITQADLDTLRSALETQINAKADAGDVATADALDAVSDALADLKADSYTKAEVDAAIAKVQSGGSIDLKDYATVAALNEAIAALEAEDKTLSDGLSALTSSLNDYVKKGDLDGYLTTETLEQTLETKNYLTEEKAEQTYLTESNVNQYVEIPDNSITAAKIQAGAITSDKINTELDAGEMVMLMSNGDGTSSWVAVTVDAE
ncbi:MAG: hypothetical protein IJX43_03295 [Alphaproteobacteria bacterium]|nr:hypothetical protein [Alphaproteobacteria bacterium]